MGTMAYPNSLNIDSLYFENPAQYRLEYISTFVVGNKVCSENFTEHQNIVVALLIKILQLI